MIARNKPSFVKLAALHAALCLALSACGGKGGSPQADARGFEGGDPTQGILESDRQMILQKLGWLQKGHGLGNLADATKAISRSGPLYQELSVLTPDQASYAAKYAAAILKGLVSVNGPGSPAPLDLSTNSFTLLSPSGVSFPVAAQTQPITGAAIEISEPDFEALSTDLQQQLILHESAHQVSYQIDGQVYTPVVHFQSYPEFDNTDNDGDGGGRLINVAVASILETPGPPPTTGAIDLTSPGGAPRNGLLATAEDADGDTVLFAIGPNGTGRSLTASTAGNKVTIVSGGRVAIPGPLREIRAATLQGRVMIFYLDAADATPYEMAETEPGSRTYSAATQLSKYPCFDIFPLANTYAGDAALFCVGLDFSVYVMPLDLDGNPTGGWSVVENTTPVIQISGYLAPDDTIQLFAVSGSPTPNTLLQLKEVTPGSMSFGQWAPFWNRYVSGISAARTVHGRSGVFAVSVDNIVWASYLSATGKYSQMTAVTTSSELPAEIAIFSPSTAGFGLFATVYNSGTFEAGLESASESFAATQFIPTNF